MIDETVIDTRKKDKNVVIISEERYGEMVRAGHGVVKSMAELEAMEQTY